MYFIEPEHLQGLKSGLHYSLSSMRHIRQTGASFELWLLTKSATLFGFTFKVKLGIAVTLFSSSS